MLPWIVLWMMGLGALGTIGNKVFYIVYIVMGGVVALIYLWSKWGE